MNDDDANDDDTLFEVRYLGGRLDNYYNATTPRPLGVPDYIIPANVNIRLRIDVSVTKIAEYACYHCRVLTEIVFHNNVTEIGRYAFAGCRNLPPIEFLEGLLRLGHHAFEGCTSLRGGIGIPASVQFIGARAFRWCKSLQRIVFAPRTSSIQLGSGMFAQCYDLQFVTFPQNLHSIPSYFLYDCMSLTHLQLPESVEEIGVEALNGSGIQSIDVPEQVHRICSGAFKNCAFLERVTIHATNLNMDNDIFINCPALSVIMIAPWLWSTLIASMKGQPDFLFKFFRHYPTQIFDGGGGG